MSNLNISIKTNNIFTQIAINQIINDILVDYITYKITINTNDYSEQDIIFYEIQPGELYLCNMNLSKRKKTSALVIIHNDLAEISDRETPDCYREGFYFSLRKDTINNLIIIIHKIISNLEQNASSSIEICNSCHKCSCQYLTKMQSRIANAITYDTGISKLSEQHQIASRTIKHHIKQLSIKFDLKNNQELYAFLHFLKKR